MSLSEKLYTQRRKHGLSQEELAEQLDCSRQVISKWENGTTAPDAEMLKKYSELFGVSIDYLLKDSVENPSAANPSTPRKHDRLLGILGFVLSLLGCVLITVFSVIFVSGSDAADKIAGSSVIVIDGAFLAIFFSVLLTAVGAVILVRTIQRK